MINLGGWPSWLDSWSQSACTRFDQVCSLVESYYLHFEKNFLTDSMLENFL